MSAHALTVHSMTLYCYCIFYERFFFQKLIDDTAQSIYDLGKLTTMEATTEDWEILRRSYRPSVFPITWRDCKVVVFQSQIHLVKELTYRFLTNFNLLFRLSLVKAFNPDAKAVSEKTIKDIKLPYLSGHFAVH